MKDDSIKIGELPAVVAANLLVGFLRHHGLSAYYEEGTWDNAERLVILVYGHRDVRLCLHRATKALSVERLDRVKVEEEWVGVVVKEKDLTEEETRVLYSTGTRIEDVINVIWYSPSFAQAA